MAVRNKGAKTQRKNGTLGRKNTAPNKVGAMTMNAIASGLLVLGTTYKLESFGDIKTKLGIDKTYDSTNHVLVFHHLNRFFKRNPGATLFVLFSPQAVTGDDVTIDVMCDQENAYVKKLLLDLKEQITPGTLVSLGVAMNPAAAYAPTIDDALDNTVLPAVAKLDALLRVFEEDYLLVNAWIEGRSFSGVVSDLTSLRALPNSVKAPRVSVVIAADPAISAGHANYAGYAAIGDIVGIDTLAAISQNVGETADVFNLQDAADNSFLEAGLSGNRKVKAWGLDAAEYLNDLDEKGYIFCETLTGYPGVYFSDSHTCVPIEDDYAYKENNYVIDKAQLLRRGALLPLTTNARLQADTATGELSASAKAGIQNAVNKAIEDNMANDISGDVDSYITPGINVLAGEEIIVECSFVPLVIGRLITLKSGFNNPNA